MRVLLRAGRRGDGGSALVGVVGVTSVMMLMVLTLLGTSMSHQSAARRDQDAKIAVAAAQAGIDEYLSRLAADSSYWRLGNGDTANPAFGGYTPIPGTGGTAGGFGYRVLSSVSDVTGTGTLRLQVTGYSGVTAASRVARTLTATLTPAGSGGYALLTDKEVIDPEIMLNHEHDDCAKYWYTGRSSIPESDLSDSSADDRSCRNLAWTAADVVDGPYHSNDALRITGKVTFTGTVTSSWPAAASAPTTWWGGQSAPLAGTSPGYAAAVPFPTTGTASLRAYVSPDVDGSAATPAGEGCYYQGETKIVFTGDTMSVFSPGTTNGATPRRCFDNSTTAKRTSTQTGLAIPPLIYVDTGTASCSFGAAGYPDTARGEHYENDGSGEVAWDDPDNKAGEHVWGWLPNYKCKRAMAYVSGTANSSVTVASQDDVVITGDVKVDDLAGATQIGLVARAAVWVWHPVDDDGRNIPVPVVSTIQASIVAQQHSFLTTYWTHGAPLGPLTVTGSVTTKYRGPMGSTNRTGSHGYGSVKYVYDRRLALTRPPYVSSTSGGDPSGPWRLTRIQDR